MNRRSALTSIAASALAAPAILRGRYRLFAQSTQAAKKPVLFSHATCRSLIPDHVRAKTDEMIRTMAALGGMMGLAFIRFYLRDREPVNIGHAVDHIDYMRKLVGVEYVGVGSDVDITGWAAARPLKRGDIPAVGPSSQAPNVERLREHRDPAEDLQAGVRGLDHCSSAWPFMLSRELVQEFVGGQRPTCPDVLKTESHAFESFPIGLAFPLEIVC